MGKKQSQQDKLLQEAYANAGKRIKDGTLKESGIIGYVRGYMKESSKC